MTTILIIAVVVLTIWVVSLKGALKEKSRESRPCQRCGVVGTTQLYTGSLSQPTFYRNPLELCSDCRGAQDSFIDHKFMLQTEARFHFGRNAIVEEAEQTWGSRAPDMLALLLLAQEDMEKARRILTPESFEQVRPWLEQNTER